MSLSRPQSNQFIDSPPNSSSPPSITNHSTKSLIVNLISGGFGGFCVVLIGYPFDFLKTRLQTATGTLPRGTLEAARQVWKVSGWRGFYQGVSAPLIGVSPIFAINFYGYELGKRLYGDFFGDGKVRDYSFGGGLPPSQYAFAATFSTLQAALIVIPADRIKVYMQLPRDPNSELNHMNAIRVGVKLFKEGGLRALYRGTTATLARDIPGLTTFFASYEIFKSKLQPKDQSSWLALGGVMLSGGLAGMTSWMISLPSDVLKSRVQASKPGDPVSLAKFPTFYVLGRLIREEGPLALYKGLTPILLRAFPANAACFLGYELCKSLLNSTI